MGGERPPVVGGILDYTQTQPLHGTPITPTTPKLAICVLTCCQKGFVKLTGFTSKSW